MRAYLDCNASAPLRPEARSAMIDALAACGNPSSPHREGQIARAKIEEARRAVATLVGARPTEVIFTGSGTEAINLALLGAARAHAGARDHVVISAAEHDAVRHAADALAEEGLRVTEIPLDHNGRAQPDGGEPLTDRTVLVAIMAANNETGVLQPLAEIIGRGRAAAALTVVDAVQAAGKVTLDFHAMGADFLAISAHKLGGPQGVGALVRRRGVPLAPIVHGGGQEQGLRSGTESVAAIAGFGAAAAVATANMAEEAERCRRLRDDFERRVLSAWPAAVINGAGAPRLPGTTSLTLPGVDAAALVIRLDREGIAVSTGSACASGAANPSHVLAAMGLTPALARATIRVSLGWATTAADLDAAFEKLLAALTAEARAVAP